MVMVIRRALYVYKVCMYILVTIYLIRSIQSRPFFHDPRTY